MVKDLTYKLPIEVVGKQSYGKCPECQDKNMVKISGKNISMYEIAGSRGNLIKLYHCGICGCSWDTINPSSINRAILSGVSSAAPIGVKKEC